MRSLTRNVGKGEDSEDSQRKLLKCRRNEEGFCANYPCPNTEFPMEAVIAFPESHFVFQAKFCEGCYELLHEPDVGIRFMSKDPI